MNAINEKLCQYFKNSLRLWILRFLLYPQNAAQNKQPQKLQIIRHSKVAINTWLNAQIHSVEM